MVAQEKRLATQTSVSRHVQLKVQYLLMKNSKLKNGRTRKSSKKQMKLQLNLQIW